MYITEWDYSKSTASGAKNTAMLYSDALVWSAVFIDWLDWFELVYEIYLWVDWLKFVHLIDWKNELLHQNYNIS